jgi:hypothetical protein
MRGFTTSRNGKFHRYTLRESLHVLTFAYREKDLQKQVSLVKNQLREVRTANESTQAKLLDHGQRQGRSFFQAEFITN